MRGSTKKIVLQAIAASAILGAVGLYMNVGSVQHAAVRVEPIAITIDPQVRAREEHGEIVGGDALGEVGGIYPETALPPPDYETMHRRRSLSAMDRAAAIKRAEDLSHRLDTVEMPPREREATERELGEVLDTHFATAADEPPEFGEPKGGPEDFAEAAPFMGLDINNLFNKFWGLFQALIMAWIPYKLGQRNKKENILTDSVIGRIDEKLVERYRKLKK